MNPTFIIDENLPPDLAAMFRSQKLSCAHINELKTSSKQRIMDDQIRRLALRKGYIIVTRDDDFVKSFVSRKVPEKMIFIHGLDSKKELMERLSALIENFPDWMKSHDFVEINTSEIRFPFSD